MAASQAVHMPSEVPWSWEGATSDYSHLWWEEWGWRGAVMLLGAATAGLSQR